MADTHTMPVRTKPPLQRSRTLAFRQIVTAADPDFQLDSIKPVEYELPQPRGPEKKIRAFYKRRGPYADD